LHFSRTPVHYRRLPTPFLEDKVLKSASRALGIVVIGRNEGERLQRCLSAARAQCEHVVYADSGSTDGSVGTARGLGALVVALDPSEPFTAARGRRVGFERLVEAFPDCEYVQFIDGDCILDPNWLATASSYLDANPQTAAVCGRRFEAQPGASVYNRLIDSEWGTPIGPAEACGGDSMMRTDALRAAGSFRADLVAGEEPELCSRLRAKGWTIMRLDAPMTEHDAAIFEFGQWWRRAERGGFGYAQVRGATRQGPRPLYTRRIASALFWTLVIPLVALAAAMVARSWWPLLLVPLLYAIQTGRIAVARPERSLGQRVQSAALIMAVKLAETKGILRYLLGNSATSASYKPVPAGLGTD